MNFWGFASAAITPVVVLILGVYYKGALEKILKEYQKISIDLPVIGKIEVSSKEAGEKLSVLFTEFYGVYNKKLKSHEKQFFRDLLNRKTPPTVKEMFPDFDRENTEWEKTDEGKKIVGTLRAVRGLGLIAPAGGGTGSWEADTEIEITKFGEALTAYLKNRL